MLLLLFQIVTWLAGIYLGVVVLPLLFLRMLSFMDPRYRSPEGSKLGAEMDLGLASISGDQVYRKAFTRVLIAYFSCWSTLIFYWVFAIQLYLWACLFGLVLLPVVWVIGLWQVGRVISRNEK